MSPVPVILVHGWNSHPGAWKNLIAALDTEQIPCATFDYSMLMGEHLETITQGFEDFLCSWRRETGSTGPIDMVCHSVGTCIARYLTEVCDGERRQVRVRQLIGLGPPNTGSALAELLSHPVHGPAIISQLTGTFVPTGFEAAADRMVQDVRRTSPFMQKLKSAGLRHDITYRIIVTANPQEMPEFFPLFDGKTWIMDGNGAFRQTFEGDGIVAHADSSLPGITLDVITADHDPEQDLPHAGNYCHINLTKNPRVIRRVLHYLKEPIP